MAAKFEVKASGSGFQWILRSQGRTLATSPTYARRAMAEKAIDSFRMAATAAPVDDKTARQAKPAAVKAARGAGRTVGTAAGTTKKAAKATAKKTAMAATTAKKTVRKAAEAVEKTTAKAAKKTTTSRKWTARSR